MKKSRRVYSYLIAARTLYEGSVALAEPISIQQLKQKLESRGCRAGGYLAYSAEKPCTYAEIESGAGIEVHSHGQGFMPSGFTLMNGRISGVRDISGTPDPKAFEASLRSDILGLDVGIKLDENSW